CQARAQYTERVLDQADVDTPYGPLSSGRFQDGQSRRLRIVSVEVDEDDPEIASVTFVTDNYSSGGLFGGRTTWSNRRVVQVVHTEDGWKIDAAEFFY
ncbi:MAG: hypothetical protein HC802_02755, partial [Caldilineaceae bacterium]|nr:hypothetical protein [Caldilineaceae bacterium]